MQRKSILTKNSEDTVHNVKDKKYMKNNDFRAPRINSSWRHHDLLKAREKNFKAFLYVLFLKACYISL